MIENNLGISKNGIFGNETIGLGYPGAGGPTLTNQVLAEINALEYWVGYFGVNPKPTNFTGFEAGQDSYMTTLKKQLKIPSLSFGYTAGNQYRLKQVYGSLTLGGYDAARFEPNSVTMNFAPDVARDLVAGIKSIKTDIGGKDTDLLSSSILAYVDSTETEIWLPLEACQAFEKAFNLTWDANNTIYSITDHQHNALVTANPNVTFTVSNSADTSGPSVDLVLPYDSFDLEAQWPRVQSLAAGESTRYFPLRRATNSTQYTIGRVFLQEVYLTVNYENSTFTLSQCVFPTDLSSKIVVIPATSSITTSANSSSTSSSSSSSSGQTIGIAVGVTVGILALLIAAFFLLRRRRRSRLPEERAEKSSITVQEMGTKGPAQLDTEGDHARYEVPGSTPRRQLTPGSPLELRASEANISRHTPLIPSAVTQISELPGSSVIGAELAGTPVTVKREREGGDVPSTVIPSTTSTRTGPVDSAENGGPGSPDSMGSLPSPGVSTMHSPGLSTMPSPGAGTIQSPGMLSLPSPGPSSGTDGEGDDRRLWGRDKRKKEGLNE